MPKKSNVTFPVLEANLALEATRSGKAMNNDTDEAWPSEQKHVVFETLLAVLDELDRAGEVQAAIHVASALEALSPGDPRIPMPAI